MPDQGQVLYEIYRRKVIGVPIAQWHELPRAAQDAWRLIADEFLAAIS